MKVYSNQLAADIKKSLRPVYLLAGDEPLQVMEAGDLICSAAKKAGYTEKEIFHVERGFDWGDLYQSANAMSLFAEKKIIDLRFTSCKPGDKGSKALIEYCDSISDTNILLIRMPKLDRAAQKAKWFITLDKVAAIIQIWPIEIYKLPAWIGQRAKSKGVNLTPAAIKLLSEKVEGNLLAAAQEIEKLALYAGETIDVDDLMQDVDDVSRFDIFKLTDAVLSGQSKRAAKIVLGLRASGEEPLLVLWALTNEIRTLIKLSSKLRSGKNLNVAFKEERIWEKRQPLIQNALQRLRGKALSTCLRDAMQADKIIKGMQPGNVWDKLLDISMTMSGQSIIKG